MELSKISSGNATGDVGFIISVAANWLTKNAKKPVAKNGKNPRHQLRLVTPRKVQERLS